MSKNVPATQPKISELAAAVPSVMLGGMEFEIVKAVTLPTLKHKSGETIAVLIKAPIFVEEKSEAQKAKGDGGTIALVDVTELRSGQDYRYPVPAVLKSELETQYPDAGYVGRAFAVHKLDTVEGKRYKEIQVLEIRPKEGGDTANVRGTAAPAKAAE